ncbi:MAG: Ig-like domain-containing protein, partial [Chitinophagaceae bacterium]|nr:Ig-like domain-containing protein [Chitinophagaceae bacterium]
MNTLAQSLNITVAAVNDVPLQTGSAPTPISVNEDSSNLSAVSLGLSSITYAAGGGSDESSQTLTYTLTGIPAFINVFQTDGTTPVAAGSSLTLSQLQGLTYKTIPNANGTGSLTWSVNDSGGASNGGSESLSQSLAITVAAVNDQPVAPGGQTVNATAGGQLIYTAAAFTDVDLADNNSTEVLTYTATLANGDALPNWLQFDVNTRTLSGIPPLGKPADLSVKLTATDSSGQSTFTLISLTEADKNPPQGPVVTLTAGTDTGIPSDNKTKDRQPAFTAKVTESDITVVVYRVNTDGTLVDTTDRFSAAEIGGQLAFSVITGSTPLADGEYRVFVKDKAGNQSAIYDSFFVDTKPPEVVRLDNSAMTSRKVPGTVVPYSGNVLNPEPPVLKVDLSDPGLAINPRHLLPGAADAYVEIRDAQGNPLRYSDGSLIRFKITELNDLAVSGSFVSLKLKEPLSFEKTYQLYIPEGSFVDPVDNGSIVSATARTTFTFTTEPYDIDGIDYSVEDAASTNGDLNGDGIPDKLQTNVSALPWVRKEDFVAGVGANKSTFIALQAGNAGDSRTSRSLDENIQIADVSVIKFDDPYFNGVPFPSQIGNTRITPLYDPIKFTLKSLNKDIDLAGATNPEGRYFNDLDPTIDGVQVRAFIDLPAGGLLTDTYLKWNPTLNGGIGGWFEFLADGDLTTYDNGAEFVDFDNDRDADRIVFTFTDGSYAGGDTDGIVNGEIADPGAPALSMTITGVDGSRQQSQSELDVYVGTEEVHRFKVEGYSVSWALSGVDANLFEINSAGILRFKGSGGAPPVLNPLDSNKDNAYTVVIEATNAGSSSSYTATHALTVTVKNRAPAITVSTGDGNSDGVTIAETNSGISTTGTLTVSDLDITDTVSVAIHSVAASGKTTGLELNDSQLVAMLAINPAAPANILDATETSDQLSWSFNSGSEAFNYLSAGDALTLAYTIRATDKSNATADKTITVTVTGTNDGPTANADTGTPAENATLTVNAAAGLLANDTDPDTTDLLTVSAVAGSANNLGVATAGSNGGFFNISADGSYTFNPGTAFDSLAVGESTTTSTTYSISDGAGGSYSSTLTVTLTGANDAPIATFSAA